jgi:TPR repeat protein
MFMNDEVRELRRAMNDAWAKHDLSRTVRLLREAAALNDPESMTSLARLLDDGMRSRTGRVLVAKSAAKAERLYRAAANLGDPNAMVRLAWILYAKRDLPGHVRLLREAASLKNPEAMTDLATHFRDGLAARSGRMLIARSAAKAEPLYRAAAELGNPTAMVCLGAILGRRDLARRRAGKRLKLPTEAMRWEQRAVASGDDFARFNLAISYLNSGRATEAVRRFRALAPRDSDALFEVARAELWGRGTRQNARAAVKKLRWLAENAKDLDELTRGDIMVLLARTLSEGWLVPRDFDAAVRWLKRAAKEENCAEARGRLEDLGIR